jgi:hypothetical protein
MFEDRTERYPQVPRWIASLWADTLARSCHQSASGRLPLLAWYHDVSRQLAIQRSMMDLGIMACSHGLVVW